MQVMSSERATGKLKQLPLLDTGSPTPKEFLFKRPRRPVWTENKAALIDRYLYYFVLVTYHGTYIDGFAGPQAPDQPSEMWAAKRVLESEPRRLRGFYLFEQDPKKVVMLRELIAQQPPRKKKEPRRLVDVKQGDFNDLVLELLKSEKLKKDATFCLLDQRTWECKWSTVKALAEYKNTGQYKIELFYFLQNAWMGRAEAAQKDRREIEEWWGRDDWESISKLREEELCKAFVKRFKELGYAYVTPWPIYQKRSGGGRVMYFMIHATDHPVAPGLMSRAYRYAVLPKEPFTEQLELELRTMATSEDALKDNKQ